MSNIHVEKWSNVNQMGHDFSHKFYTPCFCYKYTRKKFKYFLSCYSLILLLPRVFKSKMIQNQTKSILFGFVWLILFSNQSVWFDLWFVVLKSNKTTTLILLKCYVFYVYTT